MKKIILIVMAILAVAIIGLFAWYFMSPSASQAELDTELAKLQPDTISVTDQTYRSGSCFDQCARVSMDVTIPSTSDFPALYQQYSQKLRDNNYTVTTSEQEFVMPTNPNGSVSGSFLTINAKGDNKYQLQVRFDNSSNPINRNSKAQQTVTSVDQASYVLTASTR